MAGPAQSGTKLDGLKAAVKLFAHLVLPGQASEMGSAEFDHNPNTLTAFGAFDVGKQSDIKRDVDTLTAAGRISISGGVEQGLITRSTNLRSVMLVFTDGVENAPPSITEAQALIAQNTEVYAVGLGQP
jgi:hypothetical protein